MPDTPAILDTLGRGAPVALRGVSGGCIADARIAEFADGSSVFVKSGGGAFREEAAGLEELALAQAIRVPRVLAVDAGGLVLERIEAAAACDGFFELFGRRFAKLHERRGRACGFAADNTIGATPQPNAPLTGRWDALPNAPGDGADWPGFFLERRLRFQAELAERNGHGSALRHLLDRAEPVVLELLAAAPEPPSLLHGDLWSGNFMTDEAGEPCLVDPAVYYGHREADLAMTRLFGGFAPAFYAAYAEALPLAPGHADRLPLYQLYHLLNHLNLFGGSYYAQSERILRRFAR
ncbi:MAG: fructosamine kinase family protein [Xanthomonadales bacterium]